MCIRDSILADNNLAYTFQYFFDLAHFYYSVPAFISVREAPSYSPGKKHREQADLADLNRNGL